MGSVAIKVDTFFLFKRTDRLHTYTASAARSGKPC